MKKKTTWIFVFLVLISSAFGAFFDDFTNSATSTNYIQEGTKVTIDYVTDNRIEAVAVDSQDTTEAQFYNITSSVNEFTLNVTFEIHDAQTNTQHTIVGLTDTLDTNRGSGIKTGVVVDVNEIKGSYIRNATSLDSSILSTVSISTSNKYYAYIRKNTTEMNITIYDDSNNVLGSAKETDYLNNEYQYVMFGGGVGIPSSTEKTYSIHNFSFDSSVSTSSVSLVNPGNGESSVMDEQDFVYKPVILDGFDLDNCSLYLNDTGTWTLNETNTTPTNNTNNRFHKVPLSKGDWLWGVTCQNTNGDSYASSNNTLSIVGGTLEVNATSILTGAGIASFTVSVNGSTNGSTSNGTWFAQPLDLGNYTIGFSASGFQTSSATVHVENVSQFYTFDVYTSNSFNLTFYEEKNYTLIDDDVITATFISDNNNYTYTTSNGTLFADLLFPEVYTIRYESNTSAYGGRNRHYLFSLTNNTHNELELFLINEADSNVTVTVYDQTTLVRVSGAVIYVQRRFDDNLYRTVAMATTDINGQGVFELDLNDEFYKILVDFPFGTTKVTTEPFEIESTSLNLYVNTGEEIAEEFFDKNSIDYQLSFNNATQEFQVTYSDASGVASKHCLHLKKYQQYGFNIVNTTCSTASSATLSVGGLTEAIEYYGVYAATINGQEDSIASAWHSKVTDTLDSGSFGLFMTAVLVVVFVFLGLTHILAPILAGAAVIFAKVLGLITIAWGYVFIPIIIGIIIAIFIQARK